MAAVLCYSQAAGQKFLKRVTENALNTTERAVNKKIDKHIEETIADEEPGDNNRANLPSDGKKEQTETVNVKGVRKYDFVQGATVLYSEDFRQDETGAFPLKWFTQNPFRSTYFASLAMAAEMSTGILAMMHVYKRKPAISMLVTKMEANYFKKAIDKTFFVCTEGKLISDIIEDAVQTNESKSVTVKSVGRNKDGELIAEFLFTWSFKMK